VVEVGKNLAECWLSICAFDRLNRLYVCDERVDLLPKLALEPFASMASSHIAKRNSTLGCRRQAKT
jgi:hypothetical protein